MKVTKDGRGFETIIYQNDYIKHRALEIDESSHADQALWINSNGIHLFKNEVKELATRMLNWVETGSLEIVEIK